MDKGQLVKRVDLNFSKTFLAGLIFFFPLTYFFWQESHVIWVISGYIFLIFSLSCCIVRFVPIRIYQNGIVTQKHVETYFQSFVPWHDIKIVKKKFWLIVPYISLQSNEKELCVFSMLWFYNDRELFKETIVAIAGSKHPLSLFLSH